MKRLISKIKSINFRQGASFLEIGTTIAMLLYLLLTVVGIFIKRYTVEQLSLRADQMARKVVVCESIDDAEKTIEDNKDVFTDLAFVNDIDITVDYVPGGDASWKKGNYININYSADVDSITVLTKTHYNSRLTKMIEND